MKFTAQQIADILKGEVIGNASIEVYKLSKIEEGVEGSLTFDQDFLFSRIISDNFFVSVLFILNN